MIITIDGPTASGKSTLACLLAQSLGYKYLNTGLLFRAVSYVLLFVRHKTLHELLAVSLSEVEELFSGADISYDYNALQGPSIFWRLENITCYLKEPTIDKAASLIGTNMAAREALLHYQRAYAREHNIVIDGRDSGTVVFPYADFKFFLTASLEIRSERWQNEQQKRGNIFSLEESMLILKERDDRDSMRASAPLKPAEDAYILDTSALSVEQVLQKMLQIINSDN